MSRRILSAVLVLLVEGCLYVRYAQFDAGFYFWLHGLLGGALGMAAVIAGRLLTSRRRPHGRPAVAPWEAGGSGHLYSAVPDVLFLIFGVLHVLWMDVFAFHITVHFIPALLITLLVVFLLSLAAYALAMSGRVRLAVASLAASAVAALLRSAWRRPSPPTSKTCAPTHASPCVGPSRWVSPQQGTTLTATHRRPAGSRGGEPLHRAGRE